MSTATTEYGSDGWSPLDYILGVGEDLDSQGDDHSAGKGWENGFVVRRIDGAAYPSVHEKFGAGDDVSDGSRSIVGLRSRSYTRFLMCGRMRNKRESYFRPEKKTLDTNDVNENAQHLLVRKPSKKAKKAKKAKKTKKAKKAKKAEKAEKTSVIMESTVRLIEEAEDMGMFDPCKFAYSGVTDVVADLQFLGGLYVSSVQSNVLECVPEACMPDMRECDHSVADTSYDPHNDSNDDTVIMQNLCVPLSLIDDDEFSVGDFIDLDDLTMTSESFAQRRDDGGFSVGDSLIDIDDMSIQTENPRDAEHDTIYRGVWLGLRFE